MIRTIFKAALTLTFLSQGLPAQAIEVQEITSPKGIKAWLVEDHTIPYTALDIMFRGGASLDAPGKRGAINLMTATLEEGAGPYDAAGFAEKAESLGAKMSFRVSDDALSVSGSALSENRDEAAELLRLALTDPHFAPDAVARVRAQVESSIRTADHDPNAIAARALARAAWGDHPYGTAVSGTLDSVAGLNADDLRTAKARVMARDRVIVAAAGDIAPDDLGRMIDHILGDLPEKATVPLPDRVKNGLHPGREVIEWNSPQTVVAFGAPAPKIDDPDYFAALVANYIMGGGGFSSRMMDEIREKRGLTYGVSTGIDNGIFGDMWQGGMASANAKVDEAVDLIKAEWARMAQGVSDQELADAKAYLTGEYPLRFDGNGRISAILAGMQLAGMPVEYIRTRNARVESVTAQDVAKAAQKWLNAAPYFVLVGHPEKRPD